MSNPLEKYQVNPNAPVAPQNDVKDWNDENVFAYIQEKSGKAVSSWEDLVQPAPEPTPLSFANEEVERINTFIRETGRSVNDYYESQKDWSKVDNKTLVMGDIREQYPTLTNDEIEELYDEEYGLQDIDTEFDDEDEIKKITKQNKRKEIKLKTEAEKVRQKMESLKAKYSQPSQASQDKQKAAEDWSNSMKNAMNDMSVSMDDGFKYDFADKAKYEFLQDINSLLTPFKDSKGGFDYNKLARTIIVGLEHDNVLKEYAKYVKANTVRDSMAAASNKGDSHIPTTTPADEEWKRIALANFKQKSNKF